MQERYNALTDTHKNDIKNMILDIVQKWGSLYLSDLANLIRTEVYVRYGYSGDWMYYTENAIAAVWDLENSDLERFNSCGHAYVKMIDF